MKIYEKVVIDIESGNILEEVSYDYNGPIAEMQAGEWEEYFGRVTYWNCYSMCGSNSVSFWINGVGFIMREANVWNVGFRPTKIRITMSHDLGSDLTLDLIDGNLASIATIVIPDGIDQVVEAPITFTDKDIYQIESTDLPDNSDISNIEFFVLGLTTTTWPPPVNFQDDEFDNGVLAPFWTVDVRSPGSVTEPPGTEVEVAAGDGLLASNNSANLSGAYQGGGIDGNFDVTFLLSDIDSYSTFDYNGIAARITDTGFVYINVTSASQISAIHCQGGSSTTASGSWGGVLPLYLRIARVSDVFHTYYSEDGTAIVWTEMIPSSPLNNSNPVQIWMHSEYWSVLGSQQTIKFGRAYNTPLPPTTSTTSTTTTSITWYTTTSTTTTTVTTTTTTVTTTTTTTCPPDEVADYFTCFQEYPVGPQPSDWTSRWHAGTCTVVDSGPTGGMKGGHALRLLDAGGDQTAKSWDDIVGVTDIDVLVKVQTNSTPGGSSGIVVRGSGSDSTKTGYTAAMFSRNSLQIRKWKNNAATLLGSYGFASLINTWYWIRFQVFEQAVCRAKVWEDGDSEPGTWSISVTDNDPISGPGWHGIGSVSVTGYKYYDEFYASDISTFTTTTTTTTTATTTTSTTGTTTTSVTFFTTTSTTATTSTTITVPPFVDPCPCNAEEFLTTGSLSEKGLLGSVFNSKTKTYFVFYASAGLGGLAGKYTDDLGATWSAEYVYTGYYGANNSTAWSDWTTRYIYVYAKTDAPSPYNYGVLKISADHPTTLWSYIEATGPWGTNKASVNLVDVPPVAIEPRWIASYGNKVYEAPTLTGGWIEKVAGSSQPRVVRVAQSQELAVFADDPGFSFSWSLAGGDWTAPAVVPGTEGVDSNANYWTLFACKTNKAALVWRDPGDYGDGMTFYCSIFFGSSWSGPFIIGTITGSICSHFKFDDWEAGAFDGNGGTGIYLWLARLFAPTCKVGWVSYNPGSGTIFHYSDNVAPCSEVFIKSGGAQLGYQIAQSGHVHDIPACPSTAFWYYATEAIDDNPYHIIFPLWGLPPTTTTTTTTTAPITTTTTTVPPIGGHCLCNKEEFVATNSDLIGSVFNSKTKRYFVFYDGDGLGGLAGKYTDDLGVTWSPEYVYTGYYGASRPISTYRGLVWSNWNTDYIYVHAKTDAPSPFNYGLLKISASNPTSSWSYTEATGPWGTQKDIITYVDFPPVLSNPQWAAIWNDDIYEASSLTGPWIHKESYNVAVSPAKMIRLSDSMAIVLWSLNLGWYYSYSVNGIDWSIPVGVAGTTGGFGVPNDPYLVNWRFFALGNNQAVLVWRDLGALNDGIKFYCHVVTGHSWSGPWSVGTISPSFCSSFEFDDWGVGAFDGNDGSGFYVWLSRKSAPECKVGWFAQPPYSPSPTFQFTDSIACSAVWLDSDILQDQSGHFRDVPPCPSTAFEGSGDGATSQNPYHIIFPLLSYTTTTTTSTTTTSTVTTTLPPLPTTTTTTATTSSTTITWPPGDCVEPERYDPRWTENYFYPDWPQEFAFQSDNDTRLDHCGTFTPHGTLGYYPGDFEVDMRFENSRHMKTGGVDRDFIGLAANIDSNRTVSIVLTSVGGEQRARRIDSNICVFSNNSGTRYRPTEVWLRLSRTDSDFFTYYSYDRIKWYEITVPSPITYSGLVTIHFGAKHRTGGNQFESRYQFWTLWPDGPSWLESGAYLPHLIESDNFDDNDLNERWFKRHGTYFRPVSVFAEGCIWEADQVMKVLTSPDQFYGPYNDFDGTWAWQDIKGFFNLTVKVMVNPALAVDGVEMGIIARELPAEGEPSCRVIYTKEGGSFYFKRVDTAADGSESETSVGTGILSEFWLGLRWYKDGFTASYSLNGINWNPIAAPAAPIAPTNWLQVGCAAKGWVAIGLTTTTVPPVITTTTTTTTTVSTSTSVTFFTTTSTTSPPTTTTTTSTTTTSITFFTTTTTYLGGTWSPECTGTPGYLDGLYVSQSWYIFPGPWEVDAVEVGDMTSTSGYAKVRIYRETSPGANPDAGVLLGESNNLSIGGGGIYSFIFSFPKPLLVYEGTYHAVIYATDIGGNLASGQTVDVYATTDYYPGGNMWYYDEPGPGWVEDDSSDALCMRIVGVLIYVPATTTLPPAPTTTTSTTTTTTTGTSVTITSPSGPTSCPSCPSTYFVTVSDLTGTCQDFDNCPGLNIVWNCIQQGSACEWRDWGATYLATLSFTTPWWNFTISKVGHGICASWNSPYIPGQLCPPTTGWVRGLGNCADGTISISS